MNVSKRLALAVTALGLIVAVAPVANAMDSMSKMAMHKPMKKHKGSMMKGDAMKGNAMKGDGMAK